MPIKKYLDTTVYDASLDRIRNLYKRFDNVSVMFSGGKDSTAVLYLAKKVAKELGELPLTVHFIDEEVIHPTTVEYVQRISEDSDIDLRWYCMPFKHRNACSNEQPYWYCWNPDEKNLWVRDMPNEAITEDSCFNFGMTYVEWSCVKNNNKNDINLLGIRSDESLRRLRMFTTAAKNKSIDDVYYNRSKNKISFYNGKIAWTKTFNGYPIYDWTTHDVWKLVLEKNIDYNKTYNLFNKTKLYNKLWSQRVSQPFGEEPLRNMYLYAQCFPELWAKMVERVKGVNSAKYYSNTSLWGFGIGKLHKPEHLSWKEYTAVLITNYSEEYQTKVKRTINKAITTHYKLTDEKIEDEISHILSGVSWRTLAKLVIKGDFKGRTIATLKTRMEPEMERNSISARSAKINHGI